MQQRLTRRALAQTLAAVAASAQAPPQPAALPANAAEELAAVRAQNRANLEQIAKVKLPMDVEPVTRFTA